MHLPDSRFAVFICAFVSVCCRTHGILHVREYKCRRDKDRFVFLLWFVRVQWLV